MTLVAARRGCRWSGRWSTSSFGTGGDWSIGWSELSPLLLPIPSIFCTAWMRSWTFLELLRCNTGSGLSMASSTWLWCCSFGFGEVRGGATGLSDRCLIELVLGSVMSVDVSQCVDGFWIMMYPCWLRLCCPCAVKFCLFVLGRLVELVDLGWSHLRSFSFADALHCMGCSLAWYWMCLLVCGYSLSLVDLPRITFGICVAFLCSFTMLVGTHFIVEVPDRFLVGHPCYPGIASVAMGGHTGLHNEHYLVEGWLDRVWSGRILVE